jgi:DNA mismatch repair ATPase MutS
MKYLIQSKNITSILTTHFIKVCHKLEKNKLITNYHMDTESIADNDFKYTYKLEPGISIIKGGMKVLRDMDYPEEILNNTID